MSKSALLKRLKQLRLSRRGFPRNTSIEEAISPMRGVATGPGSAGGYCMVWHTLQMEELGL